MDDIPLVQVVDRVKDLPNSLRRVLLRKLSAFADPIKKLTTSSELCDNVEFVLLGVRPGRRSNPKCPTHLRFEPVDKMDNVGVIKSLQHLQLIVDHSLVAPDVFLQDYLDCDLLGARLRLANNSIGAGT